MSLLLHGTSVVYQSVVCFFCFFDVVLQLCFDVMMQSNREIGQQFCNTEELILCICDILGNKVCVAIKQYCNDKVGSAAV